MKLAQSISTGLLVGVLSGCQIGADTPPVVDMIPNCGAANLKGLVGQDEAIIRDIDLPQNLRVIRPGMAVTQDYYPDRLNISINDEGIIDRVWCS